MMKNKTVSILVFIGLLLSSCGTFEVSLDSSNGSGSPVTPPVSTPPPIVTEDPITKPLTMETLPEVIRLKLLFSHTLWQTLWMDGVVIWNPPVGQDGPTQVFREQVWVDQPAGRFRRLSGSVEGDVSTAWISDGQTILQLDPVSGQSQSYPLPPFAGQVFHPPLEASDTVTPHPLDGTIGSPFSSLIFPTGLAQREGTFQPVGMEIVAGRLTLVVDWFRTLQERPSRYWLEVDTAVVLRAQDYGKGGGETVQNEYEVTDILFDFEASGDIFSVPPADPPAFSRPDVGPAPTETEAPVPFTGDDPLGYVYFFTFPRTSDPAFNFVRLPGSCAVGLVPCPAAESIPLPFRTPFSLGPQMFNWSPDGKRAAFAVPATGEKDSSKLFVFDPFDLTWTSLVESSFIDMPIWSPVGDWIAFRIQDGQGGADIYVIKSDGNGLMNVTATEKLPPDGRPYITDGWITNNLIIRSGKPGQEDKVYLVRVEDGFTRSLFEILQTKAPFFPSPDGSLLAFDEYDYQSQKHTLRVIAPDGSGLRDLATFVQTGFYPIVWSPDIRSVAFNAYRSEPPINASVYVIGRDGRDLKQVFVGDTVAGMTFSADGRYLLVEESSQEKLYVVDIQSLEVRILQASGLRLDESWRASTWQPPSSR